jgi:hypothetical protein
VDGDGHLDIVGYTNNVYAPTINSRAVFVVSYDTTRPIGSRLYVRWVRDVMNQTTDVHAFLRNGAADFDGDGRAEIATTFTEGGTTTTYVLDGATGMVRVRLPGATVRAVFTLAEGERPTLLVQSGNNLVGYRFASFSGEPPAPAFMLPNGSLLSYFVREQFQSSSAANAQLTLPIRGTNRRGVLLVRSNTLELWDPVATPPTIVASYPLPEDLSIVTVAPQQDVFAPGPGMLLARSDGFLLVLDNALRVINFGESVETSLPGIRTGGFYSGASGLGPIPIAARFEGMANDVLAVNSRGLLLRLDVSRATITQPPERRWDWRGANYPLAIDEDGDGAHDMIVAVQGNAVVARRPDGMTEVFRVPVLNSRQFFAGDVLPLRTPTEMRFAVTVRDNTNGEGLVAAINRSGVVWRTTPIVVAGSGFGDLGIDDVNGDGFQDAMVSMQAPLRLFSGVDGVLLASGLPTYASVPITVRGRAGAVTHIGSGSYNPVAGITITSSPVTIRNVWSFPAGGRSSGLRGAVVQCPSGLIIANTIFGKPHVVIADAERGTVRADMVLAGGRQFADDAALAATNVFPGLPGNISATPQLYAGHPAFLVGSTDGYLYAIDPCAATPTLLWAMNFRAPVGEPILADTDGDGEDEIVVEAADGFMYGVDTERFPAPAWVNDVDPDGTGTDDVDETRGSELAVAWAEVPGATGYEWAVFTAGGTPISRNQNDAGMNETPFTQVSAATRRVSFGANLESGRRYFFAVRALGPGGSSSEVTSDGTRFIRATRTGPDGGMADAGAPEGGMMDAGADADAGMNMQPADDCACRAAGATGGRGPGALALVGAAATVLAVRRRRRR